MLGEQHNIILHETVTFWLVIIIEQIQKNKHHTPHTIPKAYLSANVRSCCSICKGHGWLLRVELEHLEVDSPSINIYQPFNGGMKIIADQNNENKHVVHWHKRHNIPRSIFLKPLNSCSYSFQWVNQTYFVILYPSAKGADNALWAPATRANPTSATCGQGVLANLGRDAGCGMLW